MGHFVRGYLSPDLLSGERQVSLVAALLFSPGLFVTVLISAKYVLAPFPMPGFSAVEGLGDRLLCYSIVMVLMGLVAIAQWDRLALDARDASVLGVLPLPPGQVARAKWLATLLFAGAAALVLNGPPAMIHPIISVGRLEATWSLVTGLTLLQLGVGVLAGLIGFLAVLTVRETLWALLGPRLFVRCSASVQALLVIAGVVALLLLPPQAAGAMADGAAYARWIPPVALAGLFEDAGGYRVVHLPTGQKPAPIRRRADRAAAEYRSRVQSAAGGSRHVAWMLGSLMVVLGLSAWANHRRRLEPAVLPARAHRLARVVTPMLWALAARAPGARAGASFTWRTLLRSQPHRLLVATGLAGGLAAGAIAWLQGPREPAPLARADVAVLSVQVLLVVGVASGERAALRRSADARATWLFPMAWNGSRDAYDSGVHLACLALIAAPVLLLVPVSWNMLGSSGAIAHTSVGLAGATLAAQLIVALHEPMPLVDDPLPSAFGRALPALALPGVLMLTVGIAMAERQAAIGTAAALLSLAATVRVARRFRGNELPPGTPDVDRTTTLSLTD